MLDARSILEDGECYRVVRSLRWPDGVRCPRCGSGDVTHRGRGSPRAGRRRYGCRACLGRFDDLTGTVFDGTQRPLRVWMHFLYLTGLDVPERRIARELGLGPDEVRRMASQLREGILRGEAPVAPAGGVEPPEKWRG